MPRVPSEAAAHVGRQVGYRRRMLAMTQDELAAASGIDSSNIRAYENGRALPNLQTLVRIAGALGLEPGELLSGLTLEMFAPSSGDGRRQSA